MSETVITEYLERMFLLNPRIRRPGSLEAYRIDIRHVEKFKREVYRPGSGPLVFGDLSAELVAGAASWLVKRGRSSSTANRLLRHVLSLWRFAAQDEGLADRPIDPPKIRKHKEPKRLPEAWSLAEFERLVAVASEAPGRIGAVPASLFWPALILTIYWTGVRISAVMAAKVCDLDFQRKTIRFSAETQKHFADQVFELPDELIELLRKINPGARHETVFGDWPADRNQNGWRYLSRRFGRLVKDAGLGVGRLKKFHCIRRTFATMVCAKAGASVAQTLLGHSSITTTQRYLDPRFLERPNPVVLLDRINIPESFRVVG